MPVFRAQSRQYGIALRAARPAQYDAAGTWHDAVPAVFAQFGKFPQKPHEFGTDDATVAALLRENEACGRDYVEV